MFGLRKAHNPRDISPAALAAMVNAGEALVVDVREPHEFAAGHIPGALNLPLSTFAPSQPPDPAGRALVLNCAAGGRSARALAAGDAALAARAYEAFLATYPNDARSTETSLLLGVVLVRRLGKADQGRRVLVPLLERLVDPEKRALAPALLDECGGARGVAGGNAESRP